MSVTRKTIIITNALAAHVLGIAAALSNTTSSTDAVETIENVDSFSITHKVNGEGPQTLLMDRISDKLMVVSFVCGQEFLEYIDSNGWQCGFDTLYRYFKAVYPEVLIDYDDFILVDVSDRYSVFAMCGEDVSGFGELDSLMGQALITRLFKNANETISDAIKDLNTESKTPSESVEVAEETIKQKSKKSFKSEYARAKAFRLKMDLVELGVGVLLLGAVVAVSCYFRTPVKT
jgi:hypothetical protein